MFTVHAILKSTPITYRQLDYWCRVGIVHPERDAEGSGTSRVFFGAEVARVRRLAELVDLGCSPELAATLTDGVDLRTKSGTTRLLVEAA